MLSTTKLPTTKKKTKNTIQKKNKMNTTRIQEEYMRCLLRQPARKNALSKDGKDIIQKWEQQQ